MLIPTYKDFAMTQIVISIIFMKFWVKFSLFYSSFSLLLYIPVVAQSQNVIFGLCIIVFDIYIYWKFGFYHIE